MGKLDQALRKVITSTLASVRFDVTATVQGKAIPSDSYTLIVQGGSDESAESEAREWLLDNIVDIVESNVTRAELVLTSKDGVIKSKHTIRIEELVDAFESLAESTTDQDRMLGLWQGPELSDEQKEFLTSLYKDYYSLGTDAVDSNTVFDKKHSRTYDDIVDRLWEHPKIKDSKTRMDLMKKLAAGDPQAMEEILYPSSAPGYAVDFAYEIWEKYFIDSVPVKLDEEELEEHGLTKDEDEVHFLCRAAASDGCQEVLTKAAKEWLQEAAETWVKDVEEDEEQE